MNTPELVKQDKNIVSWQITNISNVSIDIPDYITGKQIINYPKYSDILSAPTRYGPFYYYRGDSIIGKAIELYGEYTHNEVEMLSMLCTDESIVYDIGGNIGYHALGISHKAKHVYSFEPNSKSYKLLKLNTENKKNITCLQLAIGDSIGKTHISDYDFNQYGNYGELKINDTGEECELTKIDELNLPLPDIIKIDVEGYELKVIEGGRKTISNRKPIIFYESIHGTGFDLIYDFLHDELKYDIYWVPSPNYNPNNYKKNLANIFGYGGVCNCLAIPSHAKIKVQLEPMINRNDTYIDFYNRMREKYGNK